MSVNHSARSEGIIFSIFLNIKVFCAFSLESPHRGDSDEYTLHTIINIKRKSPEIIPNRILSAVMGFFGGGLKNEFEIAVVNEPSLFEPLKFYYI